MDVKKCAYYSVSIELFSYFLVTTDFVYIILKYLCLGITNGALLVSAVMHIMPQPKAENKRYLYHDDFCPLFVNVNLSYMDCMIY